MDQRREGTPELTHVDNDAGGGGGGHEAAAAGDAGVDCAEELFLGVRNGVTIEGKGDRHRLF